MEVSVPQRRASNYVVCVMPVLRMPVQVVQNAASHSYILSYVWCMMAPQTRAHYNNHTACCQYCHTSLGTLSPTACYQCAFEGVGPAYSCKQCQYRFSQCSICENYFCHMHLENTKHIRNRGINMLDTCAKRDACLVRVLNRRREGCTAYSVRAHPPGRTPYKFRELYTTGAASR